MTYSALIERLEKEGGSRELVDKNGRPICVGDILKVFHFFGPRRKRYYMYKQVVEIVQLGCVPYDYLKISHLNMGSSDYYTELLDGRQLLDVEIVQSIDAAFENRPIRALQETGEDGK
ncbi:hypothetical protein [Hyphomonas sp.]|uniref:hypothetical protein n=1 Tax=Hyphomonas sp. TaxID=87 RepID=UPI0030030AF6